MRLHRRTMIKHAIWGVFESVVRVAGPLLLREFLTLLEQGAVPLASLFNLEPHCAAPNVPGVAPNRVLSGALARFAADENADADHPAPSSSSIWLFAILLGNSGWLYTLSHHQTFWIGMRFGFHMRTQMMAAVHAKVLRLNSKAISSITTGQVCPCAALVAPYSLLTLSDTPCADRSLTEPTRW
jgi:hypothetical protein